MHVDSKNRWYGKYPDLSALLEKLRDLEKRKRDKLILDIKDMIMNHDECLFDKLVFSYESGIQ